MLSFVVTECINLRKLATWGLCRKDKYNKKIKKYHVIVEEGDDEYKHDEEKVVEEETDQAAWFNKTVMSESFQPTCPTGLNPSMPRSPLLQGRIWANLHLARGRARSQR